MADRGDEPKDSGSKPDVTAGVDSAGSLTPRPLDYIGGSVAPKSLDPHRDLAGVLHDVSNALTVLLGWVGEARTPDATPETITYALTIIEQRARIARDLARHAIGSPRIDEQLPLGGIVREVAAGLRVEATRANVTIVLAGDDCIAKVAGALDVAQVLTNLILNAIAYAPKGTSVDVTVTAEESFCSIVVADHGAGVPVERRNAIFHGASLRPGGTGVGLRHSRALARAGGGDVLLVVTDDADTNTAASEGAEPDLGARFRVTWPRVDAIPQPPVSRSRVRELAGTRILLVEDDAAVTQLLETALEGRGAEVTTASTSAALDLAMKEAPFAAALIDLSPIADDVVGAIARLRASSPGIDLVFITGSADRVPEAFLLESGPKSGPGSGSGSSPDSASLEHQTIKLVRKPFELAEVFEALSKKRT